MNIPMIQFAYYDSTVHSSFVVASLRKELRFPSQHSSAWTFENPNVEVKAIIELAQMYKDFSRPEKLFGFLCAGEFYELSEVNDMLSFAGIRGLSIA